MAAPSERDLLESLFHEGYEYKEILGFLRVQHGIEMSLRTLKRKLQMYNLRRNKVQFNHNTLRDAVSEAIEGPGSSQGYRSIWHTLQRNGLRVPRKAVEEVVRELDPAGVAERKAHKLRRRQYICPGPNKVWHTDGYDKLKPFGFPIHGCIDGYSRKVLWLYVTRSNNLPDNIAAYYLDAVKDQGGCPRQLYSDLGTENGLMAGIQSFFMDDPDSHRYVPSPHNQRIEGWWSFFKKHWASWWIGFFKDMCEKGDLNMADILHSECLWYCFSGVLQTGLDHVKYSWNTHYIRKSRFETVAGRPNSLYTLPELHGGVGGLMVLVQEAELNYAFTHLVDRSTQNTEYEEYFQYVLNETGLERPKDWKEASNIFKNLVFLAVNGN